MQSVMHMKFGVRGSKWIWGCSPSVHSRFTEQESEFLLSLPVKRAVDRTHQGTVRNLRSFESEAQSPLQSFHDNTLINIKGNCDWYLQLSAQSWKPCISDFQSIYTWDPRMQAVKK